MDFGIARTREHALQRTLRRVGSDQTQLAHDGELHRLRGLAIEVALEHGDARRIGEVVHSRAAHGLVRIGEATLDHVAHSVRGMGIHHRLADRHRLVGAQEIGERRGNRPGQPGESADRESPHIERRVALGGEPQQERRIGIGEALREILEHPRAQLRMRERRVLAQQRVERSSPRRIAPQQLARLLALRLAGDPHDGSAQARGHLEAIAHALHEQEQRLAVVQPRVTLEQRLGPGDHGDLSGQRRTPQRLEHAHLRALCTSFRVRGNDVPEQRGVAGFERSRQGFDAARRASPVGPCTRGDARAEQRQSGAD